MKYPIRIFGLCLALMFNVSVRGGDNVMDKISNGVCDCLETCKKEDASVKGSAFQGCVQKVAKPYMKDLKKQLQKPDNTDPDMAIVNQLAMQLGMSMAQKCPAMLEYILQEMPELQEGF